MELKSENFPLLLLLPDFLLKAIKLYLLLYRRLVVNLLFFLFYHYVLVFETDFIAMEVGLKGLKLKDWG